jgi:hypothetical protein
MSLQHVNSHKITIFRAGSLLSRSQGPEIDDFFSSSKQSIGSYFDNINSHKIGSGLSFEEEELLLPKIIDTPVEDKEFRKKVSEFYQDLTTNIPHGTGLTLEIGLKENNDKPLSKGNMPLELMDYIRYRHALRHPYVAASKEQSDGNQLKQFYIFDKQSVQSRNTKKTLALDAAMEIYLKIKTDIETVKQMLMLRGTDPRIFTGKDKENQMVERLRDLVQEDPVKFKEAFDAGELEIRYDIETMVKVGVLKVIGTRYLDTEDDRLIGNNLEETIFWFKDEENSDSVVALKARMQEGLLMPPKEDKKRTVISR